MNYSLCYLPRMAISRRGFFRGLTGKAEDPERELQKRKLAVESYIRAYLLPYDFPLTAEQTAEVLAAATEAIDLNAEGELLTVERIGRMSKIVDSRLERWRDEYLKAEKVQSEAVAFVEDFLSFEASPEQLDRLRQRFQLPDTRALEEEIARQIRVWLASLPNARVASLDSPAARDLVFSEIRSWC